jgi:hypothetical protein
MSISRISLKRHGGTCGRHLNIVVMPQRPCRTIADEVPKVYDLTIR